MKFSITKIAILGALAAALAVGCAATPATTPAPVVAKTTVPTVVPTAKVSGGTVTASLTDMKITLDKTSVPAGPVTFVVKNSGAVVHELVVLQTSVAPNKIAPDPAEAGKMIETGNVGETGDMEVGASKTFTVTLPVGTYVIICNEIGHYTLGMYIAFTVN